MIIALLFKFIKLLYNSLLHSYENVALFILLKGNNVKYKSVKCIGIPIIDISLKATCEIGDNFTINSGANASITGCDDKSKLIVRSGGSLIIGDNVGMTTTTVYVVENITIGNNVKIGGGSKIFDTNYHCLDPHQRTQNGEWEKAIKSPIHIGDNVFIGTSCIIQKGVSIGYGSIIAAGSVVVKNIPPLQIWGGNPAKFIRDVH